MQIGQNYLRVNGTQVGSLNQSSQSGVVGMSSSMQQGMPPMGGMPPMTNNSNSSNTMGQMPPMGGMPSMADNSNSTNSSNGTNSMGQMPPPPPPPQNGEGNPLMSALSSLSQEEANNYVSNLQSLSSSGKDELKTKLNDLMNSSSNMSTQDLNSGFLSVMDEVFSNSNNFTSSTGVLYNSYA